MTAQDKTEGLPAPLRELSLQRRCADELELLGYMLSAHPLDFYDTSECVPACDLHKNRRRRIRMAGWIVAGKIVQTKGEKRRPMKFLSMEDRTGTFEVTIFPEAYAKYARLTVGGGALTVTGRVEDDMGALSLVADGIEPCQPRAVPPGGANR